MQQMSFFCEGRTNLYMIERLKVVADFHYNFHIPSVPPWNLKEKYKKDSKKMPSLKIVENVFG